MIEKFPITLFNEDRMIRVYLPKSYNQQEKRYPVLYMHDGQNALQDEGAFGGVSLGLADYLDETSADVIVVAIDRHALNEERINEYCPWGHGEFSRKFLDGELSPLGGKGEVYVDFIVNGLKPLIDQKYPTLEHTTWMAGVSLGGLISTYAACKYPHIFTRIAAISSGFYRNQEAIEEFVKQSDLSAVDRFYMDIGTREGSEELYEEVVAFNQAVYDILRQKITNTKFNIVEGAAHNYTAFRKRVPEVFTFLFS